MKLLSYLLALSLMTFVPLQSHAQTWDDWHYHIDTTTTPQADDSFDAVYADFTHLLKSTFGASGSLDENSIRVVSLQNGQTGTPVGYRFVRAADYDATENAAGNLVFAVAGSEEAAAQFRIYFDTEENGPKPDYTPNTTIPETANMVWNSSFEILSKDYKGANRYANAGENLPRGWWGNLRNAGVTENLATSVRSGNHAIGVRAAEDKNNIFISSAPTPWGVRVQPGQSYSFSFWVKGENLTGSHLTTSSVRWLDADNKLLKRDTISIGIEKASNYDWTQAQAYLVAPNDAVTTVISVGTYSKTGVLTIDDFNIQRAVPPLLEGE